MQNYIWAHGGSWVYNSQYYFDYTVAFQIYLLIRIGLNTAGNEA